MLQERHRDIKPTYDMVAKKIFSDREITRHFIEDMLDLKIEEVQILDGNQIHLSKEDEASSNFYTTVDGLAQLETGIHTLRKSNSNHVSVALPYASTACG